MAPFLHWCFGTRKLESLAISDPKVGILTILQHLMTQECCKLYYAALSLVAGDIGIESRSMYANLRGHSGMLWYGCLLPKNSNSFILVRRVCAVRKFIVTEDVNPLRKTEGVMTCSGKIR